MNQEIEKIKKLKEIKPDEAFVLKTRLLLLQEKPKSFIFNFNFRYAYLFLVLLLIFASFFYFQKNNQSHDLVNDLNKEFLTLKINQQLEDLEFKKELNQSLDLALNYIKEGNNINYEYKVNEEIEKINKIRNFNNKSKEIDQLLNLIVN